MLKKALTKIGVEIPPGDEKPTPPKKAKKTGLPMPAMPGDEEVNHDRSAHKSGSNILRRPT